MYLLPSGRSTAGAAAVLPPRAGLGLFDDGWQTDYWGWGEYLAIGVGLYFVASVIGDSRDAGRDLRRRGLRVKKVWGAARRGYRAGRAGA